MRRLVEAELHLELLDELRIETLRAAVFRCRGVDLRAALRRAARAEIAARARARDAGAGAGVGARQLRDHPLDRAAGGELHHHE